MKDKILEPDAIVRIRIPPGHPSIVCTQEKEEPKNDDERLEE